MKRTIVDQFKETFNKQKAVYPSPETVLDKFFSVFVLERLYGAHGKLQIIFKDNSMCEIATHFNSIRPIPSYNTL